MAVRSPILIQSSSPTSFQLPVRTPPSRHRSSEAPSQAESASPRLPSPSTFILPTTKRFNSGSKAQQIPTSARLGFTSATTNLALQSRVEEQPQNLRNDTSPAADRYVPSKRAAQSDGRLRRPDKRMKKTSEDVRDCEPSMSPRYDGFMNLRDGHAIAPDFPSVTLPYVSDTMDHAHKPPRSAQMSTKASRKRRSSPHDTNPRVDLAEDAKRSKPKKQKAMSEAIILDSDEPEPLESVHHAQVSANDAPSRAVANPDVVSRAIPRMPTPDAKDGGKKPRHRRKDESASGRKSRPAALKKATSGRPRSSEERSLYFPRQECNSAAQAKRDERTAEAPTTLDNKQITSLPSPEKALRRRRSWTPPIDTPLEGLGSYSTMTTAISGPDATLGRRPFSDMLGEFSFVDQNATKPQHVVSGDQGTKRRRTGSGASVASPSLVPVPPPPPPPPPPKQAKRAKSPKKKPQTITAIATAAYQPAREQQDDAGVVSTFFAAREADKICVQPSDRALEDAGPAKSRIRGPRKLKDASNAKKPSKSRKAKADKSTTVARVADLLSPTQAQGRMRDQQFVFGTSSQLAVEESPTTINHIQIAIRESEIVQASQATVSPISKSYVKVPTAPHGTSLSVGQSDRELWSVSARDHRGGILVEELSCRQEDRGSPIPAGADKPTANTAPLFQHPGHESNYAAHAAAGPHSKSLPEENLPDLKRTPEPLLSKPVEDDSFILLSSEDSPQPNDGLPTRLVARSTLLATQPELPEASPVQTQLPLSPLRRSALRPLDANISLLSQRLVSNPSVERHARLLSTDAKVRPSADTTTIIVKPKPRGRPRKNASTSLEAPESKRPRGRPKKQALASTSNEAIRTQLQSPKALSASPPQPQVGWQDIDEICDSETEATPSPPRRRANSIPPAVIPLDLAAAGSPSIRTKAAAITAPNPKEGDSQRASELPALFSRITSAVRSVAPSNDMANPTWHEKILLYDPVVIEDLTAWLNQQGLRITIRKAKPKLKARGRKRKGAVEPEPEFEEIEEEVKHWMVQKWCQAKSICCLWKEGMRGGVRTRY